MMFSADATRRARGGRGPAFAIAAGAASLILGGACTSQSEPEEPRPEPPPRAGGEVADTDDRAAEPQPDRGGDPGDDAGAAAGAGDRESAHSTGTDPEPGSSAPPAGSAGAPPADMGEEVSEDEIDKFVAAYTSVLEIQRGYQEEFQEAESQEEAREIEMRIAERAEEEMSEAIEDEGLSTDRFEEITMQIQTDPELQQRIQEELDPAAIQPGPAP